MNCVIELNEQRIIHRIPIKKKKKKKLIAQVYKQTLLLQLT